MLQASTFFGALEVCGCEWRCFVDAQPTRQQSLAILQRAETQGLTSSGALAVAMPMPTMVPVVALVVDVDGPALPRRCQV
jgi:hypothetical protein